MSLRCAAVCFRDAAKESFNKDPQDDKACHFNMRAADAHYQAGDLGMAGLCYMEAAKEAARLLDDAGIVWGQERRDDHLMLRRRKRELADIYKSATEKAKKEEEEEDKMERECRAAGSQ